MGRCKQADHCTNPVWCDKTRECLKAQPAPQDAGHQAMWPQMIAALAAIDAALGLPEDGCNSLAQTLASIARHRNALRDLANAADAVGVRHFDSDCLSPEVAAMQEATSAARLALGPNVRAKPGALR